MAEFKLLKRKGGVDEIRDDFSDFSLSSPATKIRRLDCGLPPIVEEDETLTVTPPPPAPANEERALVLFKPIQHHSPSPFSLSLNSDLISQFNKSNQFAWSKQCDHNRLIGSREEEDEEKYNNNKNRGLAIVPWVPKVQQQQPSPPSSSSHFDDFDFDDDNNNSEELMEADEIEEGMMMDVEPEQQQQEENTATATSIFQLPMPMGEGFQQQQQHCLLPHLPQNTSTPITWTWTR